MLGSFTRRSRTVLLSGALVTALGALSAFGCRGDDDDTGKATGGAGGEGASAATGGAGGAGAGGAGAGGAGAGGAGAGGMGPGGSDPGGSGGLVGPTGAGGQVERGDWPFGGSCKKDSDCDSAVVAGEEVRLECRKEFQGGLCSLGCSNRDDCPNGALCVAGSTGNYCTHDCSKADNCNEHRSSDGLSSCTDDFDHADPASEPSGLLACIPPRTDK